MDNDFKPTHSPRNKYAILQYPLQAPSINNVKRKSKSYAQVATLVLPQTVLPKSCELKLKSKRPSPLTIRASEKQKEIIRAKAKTARLSVNRFILASVLDRGYVSSLDPVKQELLRSISRELGKQGTNLNQIAKKMNMEQFNPEQGNGMLAIIARSLLMAHMAVRKALVEGMQMD